MKVVNISSADNANFAHDNARALRSVGIDCKDVKTSKHPFNYPTESKIMNVPSIIQLCRNADVIQIFHSEHRFINAIRNLGKKVVVYQTGSIYRVNPQAYNNMFNPYVNKSITALGELMGLGAKNETYLVGAVDVPPLIDINPSIKFAHFPSNSKVKGTERIVEMMQGYDFYYDTKRVSFQSQLERMKDCDIYIELFKPELNGNKYGSFGITALEAAAMGKIVVTQNLCKDVYESYYGECPLILCDTEEDFKKNIKLLDSMTREEIKDLQLKTYNWVERNHSFNATGLRLKNILNEL